MARKTSLFSTRPHYALSTRDFSISLGQQTKIMGVVNMTPDSFSEDGCLKSNSPGLSRAKQIVRKHVKEGADILDVGGESSRPGAQPVSAQEEIRRVIPVVKYITKNFRIPISVDTYKSEVAKAALDEGAGIINTICGLHPKKDLLKMIKHYGAVIVLMHLRGTPLTMQKGIFYKNLMREIISELQEAIENCLEIGIKLDKIIIDPGVGFGKTAEHNLAIIHRLRELQKLNCPILIGTSRKSFIGKVLNRGVKERLLGTAATVCASILNGTHIVRVHDVFEMKQIAAMTDGILNQNTRNL